MKTLLPYPGDGIVYDMPADKYHRIEALSFSNSKQMLRSPAHWLHAMTKPEDEKRIASRINGSALHTLVLEPELFDEQYLVMDDMPSRNSTMYRAMMAYISENGQPITVLDTGGKNRNSKAYKDAADSAPADALLVLRHEWEPVKTRIDDSPLHRRGQLLSVDEATPLYAASNAVRQHPVGEFFLTNSKREVSLFWRDSGTGVPCKCRLDMLPESPYLPDLKSTTDASAFARHFRQQNYRAQAAHYTNGLRALTGEDRPFVFVVAELSEPFGVMTYDIDSETLGRGQQHMDDAAHAFAAYLESDKSVTNYPPITQTLEHHY